jgi:Tfp pilus assembly protein PilN
MIQFNLLPDVKIEYIKARRSKRMVLLVSIGVASVAFAGFAVLFLIANVLQPKHIADLNKDIKKYTAELQSVPDLNKVLTVQNQLGSLTALHDQAPVTSRLFNYLTQVTPAKATISAVKIDYTTSSLSLSGNADSLSTINQYVDTLKFTTYTTANDPNPKKAFSNVVLTSFSAGEKPSYQITTTFDPVIFSATEQVTLVVPKIISTRSETEKPGDLFQTSTNPVKQTGQ